MNRQLRSPSESSEAPIIARHDRAIENANDAEALRQAAAALDRRGDRVSSINSRAAQQLSAAEELRAHSRQVSARYTPRAYRQGRSDNDDDDDDENASHSSSYYNQSWSEICCSCLPCFEVGNDEEDENEEEPDEEQANSHDDDYLRMPPSSGQASSTTTPRSVQEKHDTK